MIDLAPPALAASAVGPTSADAFLLGVPFDGTSGRQPFQRHAPQLVRAALTKALQAPSAHAQSLGLWDAGDVRTPPLSFEDADTAIQAALASCRQRAPDALPVLVGGEHTITLSAVRALEPASIVSLDAHPDLWDEQNGESIAQGTWLRRAVETLGCEAVVPMARAARGAEREALDELGVHREMPDRLPAPVYLTIDVDVFDPQDAPAVMFPEADGPPVDQVLDLVEQIATEHRLCGLDLVEVNARELGPTASLGARALSRALSASFDPR